MCLRLLALMDGLESMLIYRPEDEFSDNRNLTARPPERHLRDIRYQGGRNTAASKTVSQIAFRYRAADSAAGVTRKTTKRLARYLGGDEPQVIHRALRALAMQVLPQYEPDEGPLSANQLKQIKKKAAQKPARAIRTSLLGSESP
ncbi:MAG: hypothetical protein ACYDEV_05375 [Acidiferrobacter sp.]